jgi:hypothetical protein
MMTEHGVHAANSAVADKSVRAADGKPAPVSVATNVVVPQLVDFVTYVDVMVCVCELVAVVCPK